ncbi:acyltransferase family protein [Microvirga pudoricolor]|uniref:acyltransferase family protein n=1 Tax=Microvirga pudoricolor TaxID=2778729 RepID=UPI0019525BDF|nr:acyltransferase [Microvirga pudoricolor]MBM6592807.1 acyltransferase [Microvirga pudoricolor]
MSKLVHIQLLRALAALSVAFLHAQHDAVLLAQRAGTSLAVPDRLPWMAGVDVFFVISGFIMVYTSRDLFGQPGAQRVFLARRIARIVPLYWAATTLYLGVALAAPSLLNSGRPQAWQVAASYLFVPYRSADGLAQPILSLGWTLNYEMFFYVLFAGVLVLRTGQALRTLLALLAGLSILGLASGFPQPWAFWTNPVVLEFGFGAVIGWMRLSGVVLDRPTRLCLGLGALGYLAANLIGIGGSSELARPLAWGLPAAFIVAAAALGPARPLDPSGVTRLGARVGDVSYALYLVHPFVIRPLAEIAGRMGVSGPVALWGFIAIALCGAVLASFAVHLWFERPATAWLRRRLEPSRP